MSKIALKRCSSCRQIFKKSDFCKDRYQKDGKQNKCRACKHNLYILSRYTLTSVGKREMLLKQKSRCMLCKEVIKFEKCNIDHDHKTGKVRGILCSRCNIGLGYFKDSPKLLFTAIQYLTT